MIGSFGATILTDCKNGSDKPNDNTIRLTLIRTPGTRGGYTDQGTQDIGHHEFTYGIVGHGGGWRESGSDWQGQRLNDPLIAFQITRHAGALGGQFSLLKVSNPRVRLLALKKAEQGDEITVRLVELDGKPQADVKVSFAAPIVAAREVNGQEQPVGAAKISGGALVTSFTAYQPRTCAVKLARAPARVANVHSEPVALKYDLAVASPDGSHSTAGFDGKGNTLPAEILLRRSHLTMCTSASRRQQVGCSMRSLPKARQSNCRADPITAYMCWQLRPTVIRRRASRWEAKTSTCNPGLRRIYRPMGRSAMDREGHHYRRRAWQN